MKTCGLFVNKFTIIKQNLSLFISSLIWSQTYMYAKKTILINRIVNFAELLNFMENNRNPLLIFNKEGVVAW